MRENGEHDANKCIWKKNGKKKKKTKRVNESIRRCEEERRIKQEQLEQRQRQVEESRRAIQKHREDNWGCRDVDTGPYFTIIYRSNGQSRVKRIFTPQLIAICEYPYEYKECFRKGFTDTNNLFFVLSEEIISLIQNNKPFYLK